MVRRTKEDALATRDLILDTAERVFSQRGVSRTSLHEIAQAAGVTRGAIYWHFQNKADLFEAMMHRVTLPMECGFERDCAERASDPLGLMRRGMEHAFALTVQDARLRRVFEIAMHKTEYTDELQVVRERRLVYRDACLADMEQLFLAAKALGQVRADVPADMAARGAFALMDGTLYNWLLSPGAFDLQQQGRQVLDAYMSGIAPAAVQGAPAP